MTNHYRQIALNEATAGMTLSDDVLDLHGQVLLAKGLTLTEAILVSLQRHQISMLPITTDIESEDQHQLDLAQFEIRISHLFRHQGSGEEDATGVLEQHIRQFRLGEMT